MPLSLLKVTFYVPISHGRFRAVVMPDMEEPFVPVSPESLGVTLARFFLEINTVQSSSHKMLFQQ